MVFTFQQLKEMQNWSFEQKINTTTTKILEFCIHNNFNISVSFSGGADSTVLLDLVCQIWDITKENHNNKPLLVLFADTSNEFVSMRKHVKYMKEWYEKKYDITIDLHIVRGEINYDKVVKEVGYPIGSKKISRMVRDVRDFFKSNTLIKWDDIKDKIDDGIESANYLRKLGFPHQVVLRLTGITSKNRVSKAWQIPKKWRKLIIAQFEVSEKCCNILKKEPMKIIQKQFKANPIIGTLAEDSKQRESAYLKTGCNLYRTNGKNQSTPMGFWLRQDVLRYLYKYEIPIAPPYGELKQIEDNVFEFTGEHNTGCKLCLFGCHLEKEPNRIQRLKYIEPQTYRYAIRPFEEKGLNYKEVMEYCNIPWE